MGFEWKAHWVSWYHRLCMIFDKAKLSWEGRSNVRRGVLGHPFWLVVWVDVFTGWLVRGIIPKWPYVRLVNYYNLISFTWLVGWEQFSFFHIVGIISPIDELIFCRRVDKPHAFMFVKLVICLVYIIFFIRAQTLIRRVWSRMGETQTSRNTMKLTAVLTASDLARFLLAPVLSKDKCHGEAMSALGNSFKLISFETPWIGHICQMFQGIPWWPSWWCLWWHTMTMTFIVVIGGIGGMVPSSLDKLWRLSSCGSPGLRPGKAREF